MPLTKRNRKRHIPAPSEPPRVGQVLRATGEGNSMDVEPHHDDDILMSDCGGRTLSCRGSSRKRKKSNIISVGTWNVRTLKHLGKLDLLLDELERNQINITGLSEVRWKGEGLFQHRDHTIVYCGNDLGERG